MTALPPVPVLFYRTDDPPLGGRLERCSSRTRTVVSETKGSRSRDFNPRVRVRDKDLEDSITSKSPLCNCVTIKRTVACLSELCDLSCVPTLRTFQDDSLGRFDTGHWGECS